jgi:hypothetical protein
MASPASSMMACSGSVDGGGSGGDGGQSGQGGSGQMSSATSTGTSMTTTSSATGVGGMATAYGVPITDQDGDGYFDATFGGDDCNDANPDIHPGASETPGDGIDSNCDGGDDT